MIDRYSRPRMKQVWSDNNKYDKWLEVELAVCEAWVEQGVIPSEDMEKLRHVRYDAGRMVTILKRTKHDMTAFLSSITEKLGPEGRWLHLGLTTQDVWDTASSLQLVEATKIIMEDIENLMGIVRDKAMTFKDTPMIGRTHGIHAEPITFGLKLALWYSELSRQRDRLKHAFQDIAVGKISGAVGTHATVPPVVEERVCSILGLEVAAVSSQIIQRDRHAYFVAVLSLIAASLEKVQNKFKEAEIGSYPFFKQGKIGVSIVIRSTENNLISDCYKDIESFIKKKKINKIEI